MDIRTVRTKYAALGPELTEGSRRLWAATEALARGRGGIGKVEAATGISRSTISRGIRDVRSGETLEPGRVRRTGGGRKPKAEKDRKLLADLKALIEPTISGDPGSALRWTSPPGVPERDLPPDHRRRRREQRAAGPVVEVGAAAVRRPDGAVHRGGPLPARDEQMEQDRAPPLQPHRDELAREAADEPGRHREPHRGDDHEHRAPREGRDRQGEVSGRRRRDGGADGAGPARPPRVPRRVELHDSAT